MALDQATTTLLSQMAQAGGPPLHEMTPQEARGFGGALREMYGPGPEMARVEDLKAGAIPVRVLVPSGKVGGVIVYYHGGGWVIGALDEFDTLGRQLADRTGCGVVLVDYRMAPEDPYPAAVEDSWDALCWVAENLERIAGARVPVIVAGDSAGGNLAAIVAQRARLEGGPDLALQVLVYPVTDCDFDNESYQDPENQLLLSRETMIWFWNHYAPNTQSRRSPDCSPLRADDLSDLPPAVVCTAEHDVLRDEGEAYAERLRAAGVPVEFRRFEGQMHGFFTMVNVLPGSAAGIDFVADAVRRRLTQVFAPSLPDHRSDEGRD
ncbi:alpha/beta hydrolase [Georgenia sp. AZ-5]|uniref:alpha/beta hydrolase n=1 Tax=Georgenia sp. AZ-5 TaxID=3367526 RepID=UPI003754A796